MPGRSKIITAPLNAILSLRKGIPGVGVDATRGCCREITSERTTLPCFRRSELDRKGNIAGKLVWWTRRYWVFRGTSIPRGKTVSSGCRGNLQ